MDNSAKFILKTQNHSILHKDASFATTDLSSTNIGSLGLFMSNNLLYFFPKLLIYYHLDLNPS